jgi:long-chain acyl-CoA synthetase
MMHMDQALFNDLLNWQDDQPHRLAIDMDNGQAWLDVDRLATRLGWVVIPVPAFFSLQQRAHLIYSSGLEVVCCDADRASFWLSQGFALRQAGVNHCLLEKPVAALPEIPGGTHKITFTSGTTSHPKGVCLSLSHLQQVGQSLFHATAHLGLKRHISLLPYSVLLENMAASYANQHADLEVIALPMAAIGMTGSGQLDINLMLDAICQHQADSMIMMPQMLRQLVMHLKQQPRELAFIKFIAVGGAVCSASLINQAADLGLPVFQGYGISECGSVICLDHQGSAPGSVGQPLAHCAVTLADDGEILVQGPRFLGYLGEQNQPVDEAHEPFATGDMGYFDAQGALHINGRKKHLIINSFGRNILPDWIEGELLAIDGIAQAVVCGEGEPFLTALCVSTLTTKQLDQAVHRMNQQLPDYARIRHCLRVPAFTPQNGLLTASGKPVRAAIFKQHHNLLESVYATSPVSTPAHAI